ncbi:MAG: DUF1835 domain-containing protein [Clostridiales bacterium]|nr:DUF1835 domain-containing protein [Clostridiales bacterium]
MSKYTHIVFGDSELGILKFYFENNKNEFKGEIINFREDHSIGPIYGIDNETGLGKRIKWFEKIIKEVSAYDYFEDIEKEFINTYNSIKNIDIDSKIVIWHGENTGNQVGLRYLVALLNKRDLYEINVSQLHVEDYDNTRYKPRTFAECAPKEVEHLIITMKKFEKERCNSLINDWEILRTSKENLRILENDRILGVDESYYDHDILSNCTFNFKKAAKVVGKTMGQSEQLIGDTYVDFRVRKLIESGKIEYRGDLETMRDFEIRVFGCLNEFFINLFKKSCDIDEDGYYHYLLEEKDNNLVIDTTSITKWSTIDLSNKLILDYDEKNYFSLSWFIEGREVIGINHILIDNIEHKIESYVDENGKEIKTEAIILYAEDLTDKYLEIQIKPYISLGLK